MSSVFFDVVTSRAQLRLLPQFALVQAEVPCAQGRPDYVASTHLGHLRPDQQSVLVKASSTPTKARLLAVLTNGEICTEADLLASTGVSTRLLRSCMAEFSDLNLVEKHGRTEFHIVPNALTLEWDLWAFELKVDHWQRALFQACQYRAFAQHSVVVLAEQWIHRADRQLDRFRTLGIGLFALDVSSGSVRSVLAPRARPPASRWHHLYALGRFLAQNQRSRRLQ